MGVCCCAQRNKFEFDFTVSGELNSQAEEERQHARLMNQLPTYENMSAAYEYLLNGTSAMMNNTHHQGMGISKTHIRAPIGMENLGVTQQL